MARNHGPQLALIHRQLCMFRIVADPYLEEIEKQETTMLRTFKTGYRPVKQRIDCLSQLSTARFVYAAYVNSLSLVPFTCR